jgi:multidrug resistance efflux pump
MAAILRRINLLYLSIPLTAVLIFQIYKHLGRSTASFYGFAENKETEINIDYDVTVRRVHVQPGQFVRKGTLLLEVTQISFDQEMSALTADMAELQEQDIWREAEIRATIARLQSEKNEKTGIIENQIRQAESELALNRRIVRELKSMPAADSTAFAPEELRLAGLREESRLVAEPFDREIARLEQELRLAGAPVKTQIRKLRQEADYIKKEQARLFIYAPNDGIAGYVHCKEGESRSAFTPLISFYEKSPNTVIAYVHERLSLQVITGDSLRVVSSLHPEEQCIGRVSGLGHRVVEIPERLRKIPEIKPYGREVLIEIPGNNNFLQKEKVQLFWLDDREGGWMTLFSLNKSAQQQ